MYPLHLNELRHRWVRERGGIKIMENRTISNNKTEKKGIEILKNNFQNFLVPTKEQKIHILNLMGINRKRFIRTFDGLLLKVKTFEDIRSHKDFEFIEVKNTKKSLENFPNGFFFGFTMNEECLLRVFDNFSLVFVNTETEKFTHPIKFDEYDELIHNKRIQYQINFKSK